jgi:hypothetical protein
MSYDARIEKLLDQLEDTTLSSKDIGKIERKIKLLREQQAAQVSTS